MKKPHTCIQEINERLREHNTRLAVAIDLSGKGRELVQLATEKIDTKVRKRPPLMFASYCPFCGVELLD